MLKNRTREGVIQEFRNLVFHGGPGTTLEMRVFSENSIIQHLRNAAFTAIKVHREPDFAHGIWWPQTWSLPISARSNVLPTIIASPNPVPAGEGAESTEPLVRAKGRSPYHSEGSTAESTNSRSYTASFASVKITARRNDFKPSRNEWGWGS